MATTVWWVRALAVVGAWFLLSVLAMAFWARLHRRRWPPSSPPSDDIPRRPDRGT